LSRGNHEKSYDFFDCCIDPNGKIVGGQLEDNKKAGDPAGFPAF